MANLTLNQIIQAQSIIDSANPGMYELKILYGDAWQYINSPTSFGKAFKEAVSNGKLTNIRIIGLESDNHNWYQVG